METVGRFVVLYPEPGAGDNVVDAFDRWRTIVAAWLPDGGRIIGEFRVAGSEDATTVRRAVATARRRKATVILPALPLVPSSAAILFELRSSEMPFDVLQLPRADELINWLMTTMDEARSERHRAATRRGVQQARERGVRVGTPANLTDEARLRGAAARTVYARDDEHNRTAAWYCAIYMNEGKSLAWIADRLNDMKLTTRRGARWTRGNLHRVWKTYRDTVIEPTIASIRAVEEIERRDRAPHDVAPPRPSRR